MKIKILQATSYKLQANKGFTLIETLVAMTIFVVASIIIGSLFVSHTRLYKVQEAVGTMKLHKTLFSKHLQKIGGMAKAIIPSGTIGGILYTSSSSTVVFQIPSINANSDTIPNTYDYVAFYRESNNLYMETNADAKSQRKNIKQQISGSIDSLIFRYDNAIPANAGLISGELYLKSGTQRDKIGVSVYLRNKN